MKQKLSIFMWVVFFAAVLTWLSLAEYTAELRNAYDWAFTNKITTQTSIDTARLDSEITRQALSKMMVVYSKDILMKNPDNSLKCNFTDKEEITEDLQQYAIEACQLWIMWEWNTAFNPMWKVTVAQFWTILSRALWWNMYDWSDPYYLSHLYALEENKILDDISNPEERNITRWEVITALMRSTNWVWSSATLYSEDLNEYYENFDPEIEYLIDANNFSEEEKEVIRDYYIKLESWLYDKVNNLFSDIELNEETNPLEIFDMVTNNLNNYKEISTLYISSVKNIYEQLHVDLSDLTPFTPWEKVKELEEFNEKFLAKLEEYQWLFNVIKWMCDEIDCNSKNIKEQLRENYSEEIYILNEKKTTISNDIDNLLEDINEYFIEYKQMNQYWRMYLDNLYNSELSSDIWYSPKNAKSISGYLVWDDLTRYQGDIKDNKLEWKWVMVNEEFYYSWSFKHNLPYGYWILKENNFYYEWDFRNWAFDWYWVLSGENYIYTWEWLSWEKHWKGRYKDDKLILSWEWKRDSMYSGIVIPSDWLRYEWMLKDWYFEWKWKLTLASKDIYEWNFEAWYPQWFWTLTLTNWEIYSWEWMEWLLSWKAVYIKDWKVILGKNIDIIENQWDNTIVVTDWVDTITMMDRNIWATEAWTGEASYWSFFKWWNNTEFHSLDTWDSNEYIEAATWEWKEKDQGPCPKGYHIPTYNEWEWVISMWNLKNNSTNSILTKTQFNNFISTFKLPLAGSRYYSTNKQLIDDYSNIGFTWDDLEQIVKNSINDNKIYWRDDDNKEWNYWFTDWLKKHIGGYFTFYSSSYSWKDTYGIMRLSSLYLDTDSYSLRCFKD